MKNLQLFLAVCFLSFSVSAFAQTETLPEVTLKTLEGAPKNIQDYANNGKITVLSFWATWCSPCKRELDAIHEVYEKWQEEYDMELIAISVDNARTFSRVAGLVETKGWNYDVLSDIKQEVQRAMSFQDVPYTFILDKDGKIAYSHSGYNPGDEAELEEKIKELAGK